MKIHFYACVIRFGKYYFAHFSWDVAWLLMFAALFWTHAFKVHKGKTVISSIAVRHLYLLLTLHVIRLSLVCHSYLIVCHFCVTGVSFVCHSYVNRMYSYLIRYVVVYHSYVIRIPFVWTRMSLVYRSYELVSRSYVTRVSFVRHSHVFVCHLYVSRMYWYVIRMSLTCTRISLVCTRMSLLCTRMSLVFIRISFLCLVCHSYVFLPWTLINCCLQKWLIDIDILLFLHNPIRKLLILINQSSYLIYFCYNFLTELKKQIRNKIMENMFAKIDLFYSSFLSS